MTDILDDVDMALARTPEAQELVNEILANPIFVQYTKQLIAGKKIEGMMIGFTAGYAYAKGFANETITAVCMRIVVILQNVLELADGKLELTQAERNKLEEEGFDPDRLVENLKPKGPTNPSKLN